jgi:hypothetical protein
MKIAITGTGNFGHFNAILLVQHKDIFELDINAGTRVASQLFLWVSMPVDYFESNFKIE